MLHIYKNTVQSKEFKRIKDFSSQSWISIIEPVEADFEALQRIVRISRETLEDCVDVQELPRIKSENGSLIIILRASIEYKGAYDTVPFTIILHDNYIITIATHNLPFLDDFIKGRTSIYTTQKSNFFIKACLGVIAGYERNIAAINRSVELKKRRIRSIRKEDIIKLIEHEEILNEFIASLSPTIGTVRKILQHNYIELFTQDKELISDLLVDAAQVEELANTNLKTIKNIRDGYSIVMTMNLNEIIYLLTYITAIFTIPMIIASAYGMNIRLPFNSHPQAFYVIAALNAALMMLAALFFRWYRKRL